MCPVLDQLTCHSGFIYKGAKFVGTCCNIILLEPMDRPRRNKVEKRSHSPTGVLPTSKKIKR